jgi:tetratricopeptide (TPR) repeat protein
VPLIDPKPLWDFDDPAASESRFRAVAAEAAEPAASLWMTQVARAIGLRDNFSAAHALLDSLAVSGLGVAREQGDPGAAELAVRLDLERGRLFRSAGDTAAALPLFRSAARRATEAGLEELAVDALHMVALASPPDEQLARNEEALAAARAATDPAARDWDAAIINNIGMVHADAGDFATALGVFEEALAACERIGDDARTRVAKWMVAWSLRNLGRTEEALARQRALKAELIAAGASDPYVDEELAILGRDAGS